MPKVICAACDCKYNDEYNVCTAEKISMSDHSIMTLYQGRQHFWKCKQYEESEFSKAIKEQFAEMIGGGK